MKSKRCFFVGLVSIVLLVSVLSVGIFSAGSHEMDTDEDWDFFGIFDERDMPSPPVDVEVNHYCRIGEMGDLPFDVWETEYDGLGLDVYYPTEDTEEGYPGLAYGHGAMMDRTEFVSWGQYYASRGYVTAIPDLPTGTGGFPDHEGSGHHLLGVLDFLIAQNQEDSPIEGLVNEDKMGLAGFSAGADATVRAAQFDGEGVVDAITPMANAMYADENPRGTGIYGGGLFDFDPDKIDIPVQLIAGSNDEIAPPEDTPEVFYEELEDDPTQYILIDGATHNQFGDVSPRGGDMDDYDGEPEISREEQHRIARRYSTSYFNYYIKGEEVYGEYLYGRFADQDLEEVVLEDNRFKNVDYTSPDEVVGLEHNIVTWEASESDPDEIDHYNIYRSENEQGPWDEPIGEVEAEGLNSYKYVDEGKGDADDISWWYVVRAVDNDVEEDNEDAVQEPGGVIGPSAPMDPYPDDEAEEVDIDIELSASVEHQGGVPVDVEFYDASDDILIGTDTGVGSGERASVVWDGLDYDTTYEWYATADDGESTARSETWSFTTVSDPVGPVNPVDPDPPKGAEDVDTDPELRILVEHHEGEPMDVSFYDAADDGEIGVDEDVPSGEYATMIWEGLEDGTTYEWYVVVDDGENTAQSETWSFTTVMEDVGAYELMGYFHESYDGEARFYDGEDYFGEITVIEHENPGNFIVNDGIGGSWTGPYGEFSWDTDERPEYGWSDSQPSLGHNIYFIGEVPEEEIGGDAGYVWSTLREVDGDIVASPQDSMMGQYEMIPTPMESSVGEDRVEIEVESPVYTDWDNDAELSPGKGTFDEFVSYSVFINGGEYDDWTYLGDTEEVPGDYDDPIEPWNEDTDPGTVTTGMNSFEITDLEPDEYEVKVRMNLGEGLSGGYDGGYDDAYTTFSSGAPLVIEIEPEEEEYELTIDVEGEGTTDPEPGTYSYLEGEEVTVEAIPDEGHKFVEWTGDAEGSEEEITIVVDEDKEITAVFEEDVVVDTYTLTVDIEGEGDVVVDPEQEEYEEGTEVTLTASPEEGWEFVEWTGDETGTDTTIDVTMDSDITITAHFEELEEAYFEVNIVSPGDGDEFEEGDEIIVEYEVSNTGAVTGEQDIELYVGGDLVDTEEGVEIEAGMTYEDQFTFEVEEDGTIELEIRSSDEGEVDSISLTISARDDPDDPDDPDDEDDDFPWWILILLLVVIGVILVIVLLMRRDEEDEEGEDVPLVPPQEEVSEAPVEEEVPPPPVANLETENEDEYVEGTCETCGSELRYIEEYDRLYCDDCQEYQ